VNEQKIKDAIDAIEPGADAKERMRQNIMRKATAQTERPRIRWGQYALPMAACFCLIVIVLSHLGPSQDPAEGGMLGGNPFVEVESAEAFQTIGITLDAPAGAQEISYALIDGEIAEVRFKLEDKSYLARASAKEGDFSGLSGTELSEETVDAQTNARLIEVQTTDMTYQKLIWTNGTINYCLYSMDGAGREQVLSAYEVLKNNFKNVGKNF